jgi:hypothetical protein
MKQIGSFSRFAAWGVALAATLVFSVAQAETGKAIVRAVRGKAEFMDSSTGGWSQLRVGKVLRPGAKIRTLLQSQVDLFLGANGPVVRVTEETELGIDKLNFEATGADSVIETQLDLSNGRILGRVNKMASASKYEVKTPQGVAAIKGTDYDISARGVVRVYDGQVVMTTTGGNNITINAGEMYDPGTGKVTTMTPDEIKRGKDEINTIEINVPEPVVNINQPTTTFVSPINGKPGGSSVGTSNPSGN